MKKSSFIILTLMLSMITPIHFVKADNWVEVIRFEGNESTQTESFTCDYVEWRIRWTYDPGHIHFPFQYYFEVTVIALRDDFNQDYVVYSNSEQVLELEGILNIYDDNGKFCLNIGVGGNYTIIVEQNIDSRQIVESSSNWVNVATFVNVAQGMINESFTSDCVEWRIRWSYTPKYDSQFNYTVDEVDGEFSETLIPKATSGIMYIHKAGSFNLTIRSNVHKYSLIIEKNLDFIPEFSSWTLLPLLVTATLVGILVRKRLVRTRTFT